MENQFWAVGCGLGWTVGKKGLGRLWVTFEACFFHFFVVKIFFLPFFNATFQCGCYNVVVFSHEKLKKPPKKVAQNRPRPLFPTVQPRPQPTAQNWFPILRNFGTRHLFSYLWYEYKHLADHVLLTHFFVQCCATSPPRGCRRYEDANEGRQGQKIRWHVCHYWRNAEKNQMPMQFTWPKYCWRSLHFSGR